MLKSIVLALLLLSGCSVYMAAAGDAAPDLGAIGIGATRGQVEAQLGNAISTTTLSDGRRQDTYQYVLGNEPSAGRAVAHGAADILTLGLWEVIGTPIEAGSQGTKRQLRITYTASGTVERIE